MTSLLFPSSIKMEDLPDELKNRKPVNPNIPYAKPEMDDDESNVSGNDEEKKMSLEEVLNPFLDKQGAMFGAVIMAATLVTVLALNAVSQGTGEHPVFWVTLPAAFVMLCFDLGTGWMNRDETRKIAREGRRRADAKKHDRAEARRRSIIQESPDIIASDESSGTTNQANEKPEYSTIATSNGKMVEKNKEPTKRGEIPHEEGKSHANTRTEPTSLGSLSASLYRWTQETFPTVMTVFHHLPFPLVPFAFCMFILVQALVTRGWVPVFAYGWDHWVTKTGTVGAIGGMGFISVILCNVSLPLQSSWERKLSSLFIQFAGTNIGTTILICRVIQSWQEIHRRNGIPITDRTFWGTVYSMAIGSQLRSFQFGIQRIAGWYAVA